MLTLTSAQVAPSLGRPLAGNTRTVSIDILSPFKYSIDERVNQLDLRLSKIFRAGKTRFQGNLDLYNALNASAVLNVQQQLGPTAPTQIAPARLSSRVVILNGQTLRRHPHVWPLKEHHLMTRPPACILDGPR